MSKIRVLFVGDVVGTPGCVMFQKHIGNIKDKYEIDAIIANGENSFNGRGITSKILDFFKHNHVDVVTSGNHIWFNREIYTSLDKRDDILRPANYPSTCPGKGVTTFNCKGYEIGVINLQGRVFIQDDTDCPFKTADSILTYLETKTKIIFVDFHAEATSEKVCLGYYLDGRISGLVGTHTHVQTADERILPKGTAYISDLGMVGALDSAIGSKKESVIRRFLTQMPMRLEVENNGPMVLNATWIEVDTDTGKATQIERIRIIDTEISI